MKIEEHVNKRNYTINYTINICHRRSHDHDKDSISEAITVGIFFPLSITSDTIEITKWIIQNLYEACTCSFCRLYQLSLRDLALEISFPQTEQPCVLVERLPTCFVEKENTEKRRGRRSVIKSIAEVEFMHIESFLFSLKIIKKLKQEVFFFFFSRICLGIHTRAHWGKSEVWPKGYSPTFCL